MAETTRKEESRERIVSTTAQAIRRHGYHGVGISDLMKQAGLTHGAFYAHFTSRDDLLAAAADRAGADGIEGLRRLADAAPAGEGLHAIIDAYLSEPHAVAEAAGCPVAALGCEMPRQAPEVRAAATRRIKELVSLLERQLPDWGGAGAHDQALATLAALVGGLVIARAVDDPRLRHATLRAARKLAGAASTLSPG
jgi:TetR/AcrR family transcriptional regulator, transcriptional repressor for nem operon